MFQQRDSHDLAPCLISPSKTMQIYENSTLKTIVLSIIFIKFFHPSLTIHPPYSFTPNQSVKNVTKLQSYRVTELQSYILVFRVLMFLLEWKENPTGWMIGVEEKEGSKRDKC